MTVPRRPSQGRKPVKVWLDPRTITTIELWAEALDMDFGSVLSQLVRSGDRSIRIAHREMRYTPAQRRQLQPLWDASEKTLGLVP